MPQQSASSISSEVGSLESSSLVLNPFNLKGFESVRAIPHSHISVPHGASNAACDHKMPIAASSSCKKEILFSGNSSITDLGEFFDWERRNDSTPFWLHALAGSCAGIVEHSIMYPVDTVKTRLQAVTAQATPSIGTAVEATTARARASICHISKELYAEFGLRGFFRGLPTICVGTIPAHAALFTVYELAKAKLSTSNSTTSAVCGGLATVSHDLILTPTDVVKQRLQLGCYGGVLDCVKNTLRVEGWRAFYRSIPTTLLMNVPFGAILVASNEGLKRSVGLERRFQQKREEHSNCKKSDTTSSNVITELPSPLLASYFISAGIAGGIASGLTTPLDVIKTRLQTQDIKIRTSPVGHQLPHIKKSSLNSVTLDAHTNQCRSGALWADVPQTTYRPRVPLPRYTNFLSAVKLIFMEEGIRGFWKGTTARLVLGIPSAAICWGTYESVKHFISCNLLE